MAEITTTNALQKALTRICNEKCNKSNLNDAEKAILRGKLSQFSASLFENINVQMEETRKKKIKVAEVTKSKEEEIEPLDRHLTERVYTKDEKLNTLIAKVQNLRKTVPEEALQMLNHHMETEAPSIPKTPKKIDDSANDDKSGGNATPMYDDLNLDQSCKKLAIQLSELQKLIPKQLDSIKNTRAALEKRVHEENLVASVSDADTTTAPALTENKDSNISTAVQAKGKSNSLRSRLAKSLNGKSKLQ